MKDPLKKTGVLAHDMLAQIKLMEEMTGISAKTIRFEEIDLETFFYDDSFRGLPFSSEFFRNLIDGIPTANLRLTLLKHGVDSKTAVQLAEIVREGTTERCATGKQVLSLRKRSISARCGDSTEDSQFLFAKSFAVDYVINFLRMIWYKIYYPAAFYAAVLTVDAANFEYTILAKGKKRVELVLRRFCQERDQNPTFDDEIGEGLEEQKAIMELALECYEKGITFLSPDINISDPSRFLPTGDTIRLPFNCPKEIDENGVNGILKEREIKPFASFHDLAERTNSSAQFLDKLKRNGSLITFDDSPKRNFIRLSEIVKKVMEEELFLTEAEKAAPVAGKASAARMTTGLKTLDDMHVSFVPGRMYLIGGRPGIGKTALLIQIAMNIVSSTSKPVYIWSLEMTCEQMVRRMLSQIVDVSQRTAQSGDLSSKQKALLYLCWSIMDAMPIYMCDTTASLEEIRRFAKNEAGNGALLIDYLQLIDAYVDSGNSGAYAKASVQRTAEVSSALKQLAQELGIPIIVCSQLTRALEQRADKRSTLQDLRQTCSIEQDLDGVIFIYRDSYYSNDGGDEAELILAKNKNGETGTAYVKFNSDRLIFENK